MIDSLDATSFTVSGVRGFGSILAMPKISTLTLKVAPTFTLELAVTLAECFDVAVAAAADLDAGHRHAIMNWVA